MSAKVSRRTIIGGAAALAVAGGSTSTRTALATQDAGVQSAGLGLSGAEIESIYGPGSPGQSFMAYTEPAYGVDLHIGYDNDAADYIWMALGDEQAFTGLAASNAWQLAASLLPSDAAGREYYVGPESPGSLAQLETMRYESAWLGEVMGRTSVLVMILSVPGLNGMETLRGVIQLAQR